MAQTKELQRAKRLEKSAAALRRNLKQRKAQGQAKEQAAPVPPETGDRDAN